MSAALISESWALRLGAGTLEFPPLPAEVYRVTLELPRLPLVPAGEAPETWEVTLNLRPATGALVEELFPQPYVPTDASDTHAGITLRVLEVAHSPQETALRFQVQWRDSDWEFHHIGGDQSPVLRDDLGHVYLDVIPSSSGSLVQTKVIRIPDNADEVLPTPTPTVPTYEQTKTFAPASPSARRLTLERPPMSRRSHRANRGRMPMAACSTACRPPWKYKPRSVTRRASSRGTSNHRALVS